MCWCYIISNTMLLWWWSSRKCIIVVDCKEATKVSLLVSYVTSSASWKPSYDIRMYTVEDTLKVLGCGLSNSFVCHLLVTVYGLHAVCLSFTWFVSSTVTTLLSPSWRCSGELQRQKLKSLLVRSRSLNVLPLKPGVGQYIAIHATLTARDFFLAYFYPSGPFTCIFSKIFP